MMARTLPVAALWLAALPVVALGWMIGFAVMILAFAAALDLVAGPLPWPLSAYRVFLDWMVGGLG